MTTPLPGRRAGLAALALCLSVAVAACGDDTSSDSSADDSPTSAATTTEAPDETTEPSEATGVTKEDFLLQGNAICEAANQVIDAAGAELGTDQAAIQDFIQNTVVPGVQGQIEALRALGYPEGDEATLEGIYTEAEGVLDTLASDPEAGVTAEDPFAEVNTALTDYGLTACGASE